MKHHKRGEMFKSTVLDANGETVYVKILSTKLAGPVYMYKWIYFIQRMDGPTYSMRAAEFDRMYIPCNDEERTFFSI